MMNTERQKKNFEYELPEHYEETFHVDAKDKKMGILFNLAALGVLIVVLAIIFLTADYSKLGLNSEKDLFLVPLYGFLCVLALLVYMVLHELVHGIAYKHQTGQKLVFGVSWSCAFCGVPDIYVYRRSALIALAAPFVTFTTIFLPLTVLFAFIHTPLYILFGILLGSHLGGCAGDLYMLYVLLVRYKNKELLMRDTGPEQFLYLPTDRI